jgi:hypothetical protein
VILEIEGARWLGRQPAMRHLEKAGARLQRSLDRAFLSPTFLVVTRFEPSRISGGWMKANWRLGYLEVYRLPVSGQAAVGWRALTLEEMADPKVLFDGPGMASFFLACPWRWKLSFLAQALHRSLGPQPWPRGMLEALIGAMLAELALERKRALRQASWTWDFSRAGRTEGAPEFQRLLGLVWEGSLSDEAREVLAILVGRLHALLDLCYPAWLAWLPGLRHLAQARQDRRGLWAFQRRIFGPKPPWVGGGGEAAKPGWKRVAQERMRMVRLVKGCGPFWLDGFLKEGCQRGLEEACRLMRMLEPEKERLIGKAARGRALAAAEEEDRRTAARTCHHTTQRARLVRKVEQWPAPPGNETQREGEHAWHDYPMKSIRHGNTMRVR